MSKCDVLVFTLASLCWASAWALDTTIRNTMQDPGSTFDTPTEEPGRQLFLDAANMKINVKTKTATSFQVEWEAPENAERPCKIVNRRFSPNDKEMKKVIIIYLDEWSRVEKVTSFSGLRPNTSYEVVLECYGDNQQTFRVSKIVTTLPKDRTFTSKKGGKAHTATDGSEPRLRRAKGRSKKPPQRETTVVVETITFGNSSGHGNETNQKSPTKHQGSSSNDKSTERFILIVSTIAGSSIGLIIFVAVVVACSRAMVKTQNRGKFSPNNRESGKKLITKSDPEEVAESQNTELKQRPDRKISTSEMNELKSANTLQIRQPSHLTADNRAAMSGISWGSEFDVLDKPDSIYTNETIGTQRPYPEPSRQVPAAFIRQNSLPGPTSPVAGQPWQPFSPTRAGTMPRSDEPPLYADTMMDFNIVVPSNRNAGQGAGIYTNWQAEQSIYANTGPSVEERPPAIPPRP